MEKRVVISGLTGFSMLVPLIFSIEKLYRNNAENPDNPETHLILNEYIIAFNKKIDSYTVESLN